MNIWEVVGEGSEAGPCAVYIMRTAGPKIPYYERVRVGDGSLRRIDEGPAVARGHPSSVR